MTRRRIVSLLLCIFGTCLASIGILLSPGLRLGVGITNESLWRWIHFWCSDIVIILVVIHVYFNRKAFGNYLRRARLGTIFAFSMSVLMFGGIIFIGLNGAELGVNLGGPPIQLELSGRVNSLADSTITVERRGINRALITADTQVKTQEDSNANITDIEQGMQVQILGPLDVTKRIVRATEVVIWQENVTSPPVKPSPSPSPTPTPISEGTAYIVGVVQSVGPESITLQTEKGVSSFNISSETKVVKISSLSALELGMNVEIHGTWVEDRTLVAVPIIILLPGAMPAGVPEGTASLVGQIESLSLDHLELNTPNGPYKVIFKEGFTHVVAPANLDDIKSGIDVIVTINGGSELTATAILIGKLPGN